MSRLQEDTDLAGPVCPAQPAMGGRCIGIERVGLMAAALMFSLSVQAFEVSPLVHQLEPAGRTSASSLQVRNPTDSVLPVEFTVHELDYSEAGARRGAPADDALLVFPPAVQLPPQGVQVVRLQWAGDPDLSKTRSYFVSASQLPVNTDAPVFDEGVQVLLTFNAFVHVSPAGARPDLRIEAIRQTSDRQHTDVEVDVANTGTGNAYGSLMQFVIDRGNRRQVLFPDDLDTHDLFFPPGFRRTVAFRLDTPVSDGLDVRIDYGNAP